MFDALNKTANVAMKHFEGDTDEWTSVIVAIFELYPTRDMNTFTDYCDDGDYGLTEDNKNGIANLWYTLGVESEDKFDGEGYTRRRHVLEHLAHEGYLAQQM